MRKIVDSIKGILFNNKLVDQKIKDEFQEIHLQLIHSENINEEWQIKYLQERIDADMKQKNYENQH